MLYIGITTIYEDCCCEPPPQQPRGTSLCLSKAVLGVVPGGVLEQQRVTSLCLSNIGQTKQKHGSPVIVCPLLLLLLLLLLLWGSVFIFQTKNRYQIQSVEVSKFAFYPKIDLFL